MSRPRRALLIGCNFPNTKYQLRGCCNDVRASRDMMMKDFHMKPEDVVCLTDDQHNAQRPTRSVILSYIQLFVQNAENTDLFFHISTHGCLGDEDKSEPCGRDNQVIACDLQPILDKELHRLLVEPLPALGF